MIHKSYVVHFSVREREKKGQKKYYKLVYLMRKHANENLSKER